MGIGWGSAIGKILTFLPGRIEKLKNEKEMLLNERKMLLSKNFSASASRRIVTIDERLSQVNTLIGNKSTD